MKLQTVLGKIEERGQIVTRIKVYDKRPRRIVRNLFRYFAVIALAILMAACSQNGIQTINATVRDYSFTPNIWTVRAGERVTLRMLNESNAEHEWVLLQAGAQVTIPFDADDEARIAFESEVEPGNAKVSVFTAPATPGTYRIVFGIPGHLEQGMEGTLVVQ